LPPTVTRALRSLRIPVQRAIEELAVSNLAGVHVERGIPGPTDSLDTLTVGRSKIRREWAGLGRPSSTPQYEEITVPIEIECLREDRDEADERLDEIIEALDDAIAAKHQLGLEPQVQSARIEEIRTNLTRTDNQPLAQAVLSVEVRTRPKP
jgi:hypothetical protein